MATGRGLGIVTDGLVFYYDTGNSIDSYLGEPTTNLIPDNDAKDFEGGTDGYWSYQTVAGSGSISTENPKSGTYSAKLTRLGSGGEVNYWWNVGPALSLTPGTTYTFSMDVWCNKPGMARLFSYLAGTNGASDYHPGDSKWRRLSMQFVPAASTSAAQIRFGLMTANSNYPVTAYFDNAQVEQKTHVTPFTTGTRSVSGSLLDISGQEVEIDLANVSFDSNAQMTFDGTDDYAETLYLSDIVGASPSAISFELIVKANGLTTYSGMMGDYVGPSGTGFGIKKASLTDDRFEFRPYAVGAIHRTNTSIEVGKYYHLVCTWSNTGTLQMFVNGVLDTSASNVGTTWNHGLGVLRIGDCYGGMGIPAEFNGDIPLVKIYNKALTAAEVKRNYNATKARFGL